MAEVQREDGEVQKSASNSEQSIVAALNADTANRAISIASKTDALNCVKSNGMTLVPSFVQHGARISCAVSVYQNGKFLGEVEYEKVQNPFGEQQIYSDGTHSTVSDAAMKTLIDYLSAELALGKGAVTSDLGEFLQASKS